MLYFVQQFRDNWPQIKEHRPNCCTFYNIEPRMRGISPFLLYKIQHLLTPLKIQRYPHAQFSTPQMTTDDDRNRSS
nr:hypothetical protein [Paenibacillus ginsengihumi]